MQSTPARFTNEVSPEYLRSLDHHDPEHPALAIFRLATEGSRSRNGGVIRNASSPVEITLPNGDKVRVACAGDLVEYADGSSAVILSESGEEHGQVAVVGSRIANGDEIIDTPQRVTHLIKREGKPFSLDHFRLKRA